MSDNTDTIKIDQFYGGQKGSNCIISQIFSGAEALIADLNLKTNSPNPVGSLVMIGYSDFANTGRYNDDLAKDAAYGNLNSSVWLKQILTITEKQQLINAGKKIIEAEDNAANSSQWCYVWQYSSLGVNGQNLNFVDSFNIDTETDAYRLDDEHILNWWQTTGIEIFDQDVLDEKLLEIFEYVYGENKNIQDRNYNDTIVGNFYLYQNKNPADTNNEEEQNNKIYLSIYFIRNSAPYKEEPIKTYYYLSKITGVYTPPSDIVSIEGFMYDKNAKTLLLGGAASNDIMAEAPNSSIMIGEGLKSATMKQNSEIEIALGKYNAPQTGSIFTIGNGTNQLPNNLFEIRKNTNNEYEIYLNHEKIHPLTQDLESLNNTITNIKKIPFIASHLNDNDEYISYQDLTKDMVYTKKGEWKTINTEIKDNKNIGIFLPEEEIGLIIKPLRLGTKDSYFNQLEWRIIDKQDYGDLDWKDSDTCYYGKLDLSSLEIEEDKEEEIYIYPHGYISTQVELNKSSINLYASHEYYLILTYTSREGEKVSFGQTLNFKGLVPKKINNAQDIDFYEFLGTFTQFGQPCYLGEIDEEPENANYYCKIFEGFPGRIGTEKAILIRDNENFYISTYPGGAPTRLLVEDIFPLEGPLPANDFISKITWAIIKETGQTIQLQEIIKNYWKIGDYKYFEQPNFYSQYKDSSKKVAAIADYNKDLAYGLQYPAASQIDTVSYTAANQPSPNYNSFEETPNQVFLTLIHLQVTTNKQLQNLEYTNPKSSKYEIYIHKDTTQDEKYPYRYCGYYNIYDGDHSSTDFVRLRGVELAPSNYINDLITPVYKKTVGDRTIDNIQQPLRLSVHKYFIPSEYEATGTPTLSTWGEGEGQYEFFKKYPLKTLYPKLSNSNSLYNHMLCLRSPTTLHGGWIVYSTYFEKIMPLPRDYTQATELFGNSSIKDVVYFDDTACRIYRITSGPTMFCL